MTTRELPVTEWDRLCDTDLPAALVYVRPEDAKVMVVERDGRIVGAWAALRVTHLEGVWIAPEYRKRASVAGRLLRAGLEAARSFGSRWAMTGAQTEDVAALIRTHLGGVRIPMDTYVIPLEGR